MFAFGVSESETLSQTLLSLNFPKKNFLKCCVLHNPAPKYPFLSPKYLSNPLIKLNLI